ncbi:MAG: DNA gyrase subunit A [Alphaproteobacteria bacterium]|nr:DNA gyrase subunit A [Alphaproteobacteria bacterium]MBU1516439.1 DNA gyrase subunit A [Alphaproteobacteria bacterium]MBU2094196.1 DNA gyrase subunit A [Alphaproteobacteria bacterium]MBU2150494.1 DNA gyrase subunit A [Alphaproteobacteria bacterium]MBU2307366.1 DNA gyrase subunit A [Alphaproteobacteria bacterium]
MTDDSTTTPPEHGPGGIAPIAIEDELKRSYLDYAMSVIVSRALPDVRDGLKPVHRRILFSMGEQGHTPDRSYVKSARIVGDVMGKYHPHGDVAIYDTLVRLAQPFSMSLLLIDGQGNFGSVDNDPPAAMRYTESRMTRAAMAILADLDKDTVDFKDNYDGSESEPVVLPSRIPNLLVNGAGGIAVGMATNIPPHNLGEIVDACLAYIDDPEISLDALLDIVPGPDFPTGGQIVGRTGARTALMTGRGSVIMRGIANVEEIRKDREAIIITAIPYQLNKASLVERIAELVREKRVEGVSDLRDESDRQGMRIVIEMKRDASAEVLLNQLYRYTPLQSSFGVNMLALNRGRPEQMGLREMVTAFVDFREEVVVRRTKFELSKARDRGHVLVGLAIAVANIDEFIHIIRSSKDPTEARERLVAKDWPAGDMLPLVELIADPRTLVIDGKEIRLTDEQARAILALTLSRLTGLGRDEIFGEARELANTIQGHLEILASRERIMAIVREELVAVRDAFAVPRRTEIIDGDADVEDEDLIAREDMVITVTHGGYVKRTPLSLYRTQHRGGKGRSGMATKEEDAVTRVFSANTHTPMLFFSSGGKAYKLKVWRLPVGTPTSRGKAFVNLLPIEPGETITSILPLPEDEATWDQFDVMFATRSGNVRRNKLSDFIDIRRNGKIAMKLDEGDSIIGVGVCNAEVNDILLTTALGRCIRFVTEEVRVFAGRDSTGVRGIRLAEGDSVISMAILRAVTANPAERTAYVKHANAMRRAISGDGEEVEDVAAPDDEEAVDGEAALSQERIAELGAAEEFILTVSTEGYGKRTSAYEFRRTGRGGQGLLAQDLTKKGKGGRLAASFPVEEFDQILLVTDQGQLIRTPVTQVRVIGRNTSGVTIFRTSASEHVVSVERLADQGEDEDIAGIEGDVPDAGGEGDTAPDAGQD